MHRWIRWSLALAGAAAGTVVAGSLIGVSAWNRQTERVVGQLNGGATRATAAAYSAADLDGLPPPVARYFEFALTPGQPLVRAARIEHEGEFRSGPDAPWSPFRSVQHFRVHRPAFVWDARVRMAPLVAVRVRDSYLDGSGAMRVRVAGLVSVVDEEGTPHLNEGALHRLFLEAPWFPTALLPRSGVHWEPIDDRTARATLHDAGMTVSMTVHFADGGEIVRVEAGRLRDVDGAGVATPFVARVGRYERIGGMMVPVEGEVEWILPDGPFPFWRGRITSARYE